jgi:hypothetical protein
MKRKEDIRQFYNREILPNLSELEAKVKKEKKIYTYFLVSFLTTLFGSFIFENVTFFLIGFTVTIVFFYILQTEGQGTNDEYIELIVKPLIKEIDPSLDYRPYKGIDRIVFENSLLFPIDKRVKYKSNNLTKGVVNNTPIEFGNIISYIPDSDDKDEHLIFDGLFISTKMKKNISGTVCIYPDFGEKYLGFVGKGIQESRRNDLDKVTLDSLEFEKEFVVYADNPIDANYILTHSMMERILDLKKNINAQLYISFQKQNVYIAVNNFGGIFQYQVNINFNKERVLTFENIEKHIDLLHLTLNLADNLKLDNAA